MTSASISHPISHKRRFNEDTLDSSDESKHQPSRNKSFRLDESVPQGQASPLITKELPVCSLIKTATATTTTKPPQEIKRLDPALQANTGTGRASPDTFVQKLFQAMLGFQPITRPTLELAPLLKGEGETPFIPPKTEDELADYSVDVVTATREEDLPKLKTILSQGRSLSCSNRYGESLLHMACRRGFFPVVSFLTQEANCSIRITDDCGRTPLHDALWNKNCQYEIVDLLIRKDPSLLLMCDKHGHTPFQYARREHWELWKRFLWDRRKHILLSLDVNVMELFRAKIL